MKKRVILLIFSIAIFSNFINASLVENQTWQQNFTSSDVHDSIAFGDLDNDGDLDMIQTGCESGNLLSCDVAGKTRIYINNGTSLVENQTWQQNLGTTDAGSVALGDLDNDGDLDLVLTADLLRVYTNNGTSLVENQTWQQEVINQASSLSVNLGDLDNDGDLDLVLVDMGNSPGDSIWINNGTTFVGNTFFGQETRENGRASNVLADVDNDNDLDSVSIGYDYFSVYLNNLTTLELSSLWGSGGGLDHASMAVGDVDSDGDLDFFTMGLRGSCSDAKEFWQNNGSTWVSNSSWENVITGFFYGFASFGDYDNNGYLDLVTTGQCGGTAYSRIYNNSGANFTRDLIVELNISPTQSDSSVLIDIDNDNNLDLIMMRAQKVYINNITTINNLPAPPESFSYSYKNREIYLGWLNGSDSETPSTGLYYNMKLGTMANNHSIVSGIYGGQGDVTGGGGTAFGYFGNMMQRKNITLKVDRLQPSTTYYWGVQTIDTALKAGSWSSVQSFTTPADMERPNITLNSPVNYANFSSYSVTFNTTVFDDTNLTKVSLWGNWTGSFIINETNSSGINNTDYIFLKNLTSYGDGTYNWRIQATDNETNSQNSSIRYFTIDTIAPSISIISPSNTANSSDAGLDITYIASDSLTGLDSCWYTNDSSGVNTTITCNTNITAVNWSEGEHNVTIWANDSAGNENSSTINFTIDTTSPFISILSPSNNLNTTDTELDINYTTSDSLTGLDSCWYTNDSSGANTSVTCNTNLTTLNWSEGEHNITIWANDSARNENSSIILFRIDTTGPAITIVNPINGTNSSNTLLDVNYTVLDSGAGLDSCWYSNDTYSVNNSITCGTNLTTLNWSDFTSHNVTIWANDTLGNENQSIVFFTINTTDITSPNITLISPTNSQSYTSNSQEVTFIFNITEKNEIGSCNLIINNIINSTNSSVNKLINQSFTKIFTPGSYTWNINCTDTNNNVGNASSRSFRVNTPTTTTEDGGTGGSTTTTIPVIKEEKLQEGQEKQLNEGSKIKLEFANQGSKILEIVSVEENTVKIKINDIEITITNGTTEKIDVNKDGFYDLEVSVEEITGSSSSRLKFKEIYEAIGSEEQEQVQEEAKEKGNPPDSEIPSDEKNKWWIYAIIAGGIGIIIGIYFIFKNKIIRK